MNNENPDEKPKLYCGKSLTKQSFLKDANINTMVARFKKSGMFENVTDKIAQYADLSKPVSYRDSLDHIISAQAQFDALPALVRQRFQNEPAELIDFVQNEDNRDEAIRLGLLPKPKNKKSSASQKDDKSKIDGSSIVTEPKAKASPPKAKE